MVTDGMDNEKESLKGIIYRLQYDIKQDIMENEFLKRILEENVG